MSSHGTPLAPQSPSSRHNSGARRSPKQRRVHRVSEHLHKRQLQMQQMERQQAYLHHPLYTPLSKHHLLPPLGHHSSQPTPKIRVTVTPPGEALAAASRARAEEEAAPDPWDDEVPQIVVHVRSDSAVREKT